MRALASASRLLPLAGGVGVSSIAGLHTLLGIVTAVLTAIYTTFITIEAGLRLYERHLARKAAKGSPRTKADA